MRISFAGYLWRYVVYFVLVGASIFAVLKLLERFAPTVAEWLYGSGAGTGLNIAAVMLPGVYLGQKWHRTEGRAMPRRTGWALAVCGAFIALILGVAIAAIALRGTPMLRTTWADIRAETSLSLVILSVSFVLLVLISRFSTWTAIRGEMRRQPKPK